MTKSPLFSLKYRDLIKGLVVSVLTTIITALAAIFKDGNMPTMGEWRSIGIAALGAGAGYLLKNLFTNSQDQILKKEPESPYK